MECFKNKVQIYTIWIGIGIAVLLLCVKIFYNNTTEPVIKFIPTYGDIRCLKSSDNILDLFFIAQNESKNDKNSLTAENNRSNDVAFDKECIQIKDYSLSQTNLTWGNYILYQATFTFDLLNNEIESSNITLSTVKLNGKVYNIGKINLQYSNDSQNRGPLRVISQAIMCQTIDLADFPLKLKNMGETDVVVTEIITESFPHSAIIWDISDQDLRTEKLPYYFPKGEEHTLDVTLTSCKQEGYQVYYVSPIIRYTNIENNYQYYEYPCSFLTGIPQSTEDLCGVVNNIF